jgi:hypothetical protein
LETAVELCFELNDQKALRENITLLSKRRGQLKAATKKMVKKAMTYLDKLDQENKMALLDVLMKVTEGKVRFFISVSYPVGLSDRLPASGKPNIALTDACRLICAERLFEGARSRFSLVSSFFLFC